MSVSMYDLSVTRFNQMMRNLIGILDKAKAHCEAKNIDQSVLPTCRVIADMLPLSKQVQIVSDQAKGCVARLAGQKPPSYEDNESTLDELIARLNKTIAYLEQFTPEQINGSETKEIVLEFPNMTLNMDGVKYLLGFTTPNVYFHVTTTYNILRANGVDLGKRDFIGQV